MCIDGEISILSGENGDALFNEEGQATPALDGVVELTTNYYDTGKRTEAFVAVLEELGLFRQITIEQRVESDPQTIPRGAMIDNSSHRSLGSSVSTPASGEAALGVAEPKAHGSTRRAGQLGGCWCRSA